MQKKSDDFSMQEALRLAKSPAGQQLLAMLKQGNSDQLQQVVHKASAGDLAGATQTLNAMLSSQEAQALLRQMEDQ